MRHILIFLLLLGTCVINGHEDPCCSPQILPCCISDAVEGRGNCLNFLNASDELYEFEIDASYLYWKGVSDGLDYFYTFVDNFTPTGDEYSTDAHLFQSDFDWRGAYRVSAGFAFDSWDTEVVFTHFEAKDSKIAFQEIFSPGATIGGVSRKLSLVWPIIADNTNDNDYQTMSFANGHAKLKYQVLDWLSGFSIAFHRNFYLHPFFGVRGAWINQSLQINAKNTTPTIIDAIRSDTDLLSDFKGAGLVMGGNSKYPISKWFSLYGDLSFSFLAGTFTLKQNQELVTLQFPDITLVSHSNLSRAAVRPSLEMGMGVNFSYKRNCSYAEISLGYEVNYWPSQNEWRRFTGLNDEFQYRGDLIFHGCVVRGSVIF